MESPSDDRIEAAEKIFAKPSTERIGRNYEELLGRLPQGLANRAKVAQATGRVDALEAIEQMREELLHRNPLDRRTQQLVHFGMLVALQVRDAARLHALGAMKAGATLSDLQGVAETAAVVAGMPGFGLAIEVIAETALNADGAVSSQPTTHHDSKKPTL